MRVGLRSARAPGRVGRRRRGINVRAVGYVQDMRDCVLEESEEWSVSGLPAVIHGVVAPRRNISISTDIIA
jgi:hypothetical protein